MTSPHASNSDHPVTRTARHLEQGRPGAPRPQGSPVLQAAWDLARAADTAWTQATSLGVVGATTAGREPGREEGVDLDGASGLVALERALDLQLATAQALSLIPPGDREALDVIPLRAMGAPTAAADPACRPRAEERGQQGPIAALDAGASDWSKGAMFLAGEEVGVPAELVRDCERQLRAQPLGDLPSGMSSLLMTVSELLRDYAALPNGPQARSNPETPAASARSSDTPREAGGDTASGAASTQSPAPSGGPMGSGGPGWCRGVDPRQAGSTIPPDDRPRDA